MASRMPPATPHLSQPPYWRRLWELEAEREANDARNEEDLLLEDEIEQEQELETCLAFELHQMPALKGDAEDDDKLQSFTLSPLPPALEQEYATYKDYRLEPLNRMRDGSCVVDLTASNDVSTCEVGAKPSEARGLGAEPALTLPSVLPTPARLGFCCTSTLTSEGEPGKDRDAPLAAMSMGAEAGRGSDLARERKGEAGNFSTGMSSSSGACIGCTGASSSKS